MKSSFSSLVASFAVCFLALAPITAQEKSVRPGINKPFENPDLKDFIQKFEGESREIAALAKEIVAACKIKPGMVVADVGAGTGLFTRKFALEVGEKGKVYAVEIAPTFLRHIEKTCEENKLKNVKTVLCDQFSVKLPKNAVDFVFICDTYHHFEFPQKTLQSIHDALRPKGQVILIDFHRIKGKSSDWVMGHVRAGQEVFVREIKAAGFKVVGEERILKENYFVRFEKKALLQTAKDAASNERKKLHGAWKVVSIEVNGKKANEKKIANFKWVFTDDTITWSDGMNKFLYKLNPTTKPSQIDLTFPERKTDTTEGVYSLDGDDLKVCIGKTERPTDFSVKAGSKRFLYIMKRERESGQDQDRAEPKAHRGLAYAETKNERQMLDVYAPIKGKNHPVVVWIHGGGWRAGDKKEVHYKPQAFADKGFVFVSINYRLLPTVTIKQMAGDVAKAIRWVHDHAKDYGGDPNTIIVAGHSAGAQLAALVCTNDRYLKAEGLSLSTIKACLPVDGDTYDVAMQIMTVEAKRAAIYRIKFGDEKMQKELSSVTHVAKGKNIPPFLILHVADHPETKAQSLRLVKVLQGAGISAKTYPAEGKNHTTLKKDLGLADDRPTQEMWGFLSSVLKK